MYHIERNGVKVGEGLSKGEFNQWILELDESAPEETRDLFRADLGLSESVDRDGLENFLYEGELDLPITTILDEKQMKFYKD